MTEQITETGAGEQAVQQPNPQPDQQPAVTETDAAPFGVALSAEMKKAIAAMGFRELTEV